MSDRRYEPSRLQVVLDRLVRVSWDDDDRLSNRPPQVLLLDGGAGEELFTRGVPDTEPFWSANAILYPQYHNILKQVHQDYLQAGSQAVTTNSFGLKPGWGWDSSTFESHYITAAQIARRAVDQHHRQQQKNHNLQHQEAPATAFVFGSMGPLIQSFRPDKIYPHDEGVAIYQNMSFALFKHVDALLAETLSSLEEALQVVEAWSRLSLSSTQHDVPCFISFTVNEVGHIRSGEAISMALPSLLDFAQKLNVKIGAILFNCSEPENITRTLQEIKTNHELQRRLARNSTSQDSINGSNVGQRILLGAYANRLKPIVLDWSKAAIGDDTLELFRSELDEERYYHEYVKHWVQDLDVRIVGGCCGMTPKHIAVLKSYLDLVDIHP